MLIVEVVTNIISASLIIKNKADVKKITNAACLELLNQIDITIKPLQILKTEISDTTEFRDALLQLKLCLDECLTFIEKYDEKGFAKKLVLSASYQQQVDMLSKNLHQIAGLLSLALNVRQLVNTVQHNKNLDSITQKTDAIIELQKLAQTELSDLKLSNEQLKEVLKLQVESITATLTHSKKRSAKHKSYVISRYELLCREVLAEGNFGIIYRGRWREDEVAIKSLKSLDKHSKNAFEREVEIMSRLRNENIVQFYAACLEEDRESLVMEYMSQGSLQTLLHSPTTSFSDQQKIKMASHIAKGLQHLHGQNMLHRDLKLSSILVNADGHAKITDFRTTEANTRSMLSIYGENEATDNSLLYMAPEYLEEMQYSKASDIYSYGVILWQLFSGKPLPLDTDQTAKSDLASLLPESLHADVKTLITGCLFHDPQTRLSLTDIIKHLEDFKTRENYALSTASTDSSNHQAINFNNIVTEAIEKAIAQSVTNISAHGQLTERRQEILKTYLATLILDKKITIDTPEQQQKLAQTLEDSLKPFFRRVRNPVTALRDHNVTMTMKTDNIESDIVFRNAINKACEDYQQSQSTCSTPSLSQ